MKQTSSENIDESSNQEFEAKHHPSPQVISMPMIILLAFVLMLLLSLSIWQFNRGFEKQAISNQFDLKNNQTVKSMHEFNDFNNLDAPPPIFTQIKMKGVYSQAPQDLIWIERFTEFQAPDQNLQTLEEKNEHFSASQNTKNIQNNLPQAKKPHYLLMQKLYVEQNSNNIRPIWVWRGISDQVLSFQQLQSMPKQIEKVMRVIPRIPQILTLGQNCYPFNADNLLDLKQKTDASSVLICQNFDQKNQRAKFIMMDVQADQPLRAIQKLEILRAHFIKISPQRHFAYGTTWLALALAIVSIIIYKRVKKKKAQKV